MAEPSQLAGLGLCYVDTYPGTGHLVLNITDTGQLGNHVGETDGELAELVAAKGIISTM